jgi:hypothetical protein
MNSLLKNIFIVIVIQLCTGEYIVIILYNFVCNYSFEYFSGVKTEIHRDTSEELGLWSKIVTRYIE